MPFADPLQRKIASTLWRAVFATPDQRRELIDLASDFASHLEFYLCGLLKRVPVARLHGLWCDGVMELSIKRINRVALRIVGAAYLMRGRRGGFWAPFELEFHFASRRGLEPVKEVFRCGFQRQIEPGPHSRVGKSDIVSLRPVRDSDWAIAVELTPLLDRPEK